MPSKLIHIKEKKIIIRDIAPIILFPKQSSIIAINGLSDYDSFSFPISPIVKKQNINQRLLLQHQDIEEMNSIEQIEEPDEYIEIDIEVLKQRSIMVFYRKGEYNNEDETCSWSKVKCGWIHYNENGIITPDGTFEGFHDESKTYWKYYDEGLCGDGKYCLKILKINEKILTINPD